MNKHRLVIMGVILIAVIMALSPALSLPMSHSPGNAGTGAVPTASATELGKSVYIGEFSNSTSSQSFFFNVSWAVFNTQSTGKVFYSYDKSINKNTTNVSFTTNNFTFIRVSDIGTVYFLIQNGTAFPSSLTTEFSNNIPVSFVLEKFKVDNIGNKFVNVSWSPFKDQRFVQIYYVKGNDSKISSSVSSVQVNGTFSILKMSNYTEYSFLLVNGSIYPAGASVNVSSFVESINLSAPAPVSGLLIGFNGQAILISEGLLIVGVVIVVAVAVAIKTDKMEHKHKRKER